MPVMSDRVPPTTFLLTDVEGSTKLWESQPSEMRTWLTAHDQLVSDMVASHGGHLVKERGEGDSCFCVFTRSRDALAAAVSIQQTLDSISGNLHPRVRMAIHCGEAELRDGDYYGPTVNRCARLRAISHGGQILLSGAAWELARDAVPKDGVVQDLGMYYLRDLSLPERVLQISAPGQPTEFPPLLSSVEPRGHLPAQLTPLLGRAHELAEAHLRMEQSRLLTVVGPGGVGKTKFALSLASDLSPQFDGRWFIDLTVAEPTPQGVARQIVDTMSAPTDAARGPVEALLRHVAQRHVLFILDNCEHLIEPAAEVTEALLLECNQARIIVTSRERLDVEGEMALTLGGLPPDEATELFVNRALAVNGSFVPNPSEVEVIRKICMRLDRLPLAIELAASRTDSLSVSEIEKRLGLALLSKAGRRTQSRHSSVRDAIDWSVGLLDGHETALFERLAIFAGSFGLEAVEHVCLLPPLTEASIVDVLGGLVRKSLVTLVARPEGAARYNLLYPVHEVAQERLGRSTLLAELRKRFIEFYAQLASRAEPAISGRTEVLDAAHRSLWLQQLDDDAGNLQHAVDWTLLTQDHDHHAQLALALWSYWSIRGNLADGRQVLRAAVHGGHLPADRRAEALNALGELSRFQGDLSGARDYLTEALDLIDRSGSTLTRADVLNNLADIEFDSGDMERARSLYEEALRLAEQSGADWRMAYALGNLGLVDLLDGDPDASVARERQSLEMFQQLDYRAGIAYAQINFGVALWSAGDSKQAPRLIEEGLAAERLLDDRWNIARGLECLAAASAQTDGGRALELEAEAAAIRETIGAPRPKPWARWLEVQLRPATRSKTQLP